MENASDRIFKYRRATVTVRVSDQQGLAASGLDSLEVVQVAQAFPFGTAAWPEYVTDAGQYEWYTNTLGKGACQRVLSWQSFCSNYGVFVFVNACSALLHWLSAAGSIPVHASYHIGA